jgi:hypothetical protein
MECGALLQRGLRNCYSRSGSVGGDCFRDPRNVGASAENILCYQCSYELSRGSNCWRPKPFDISIATYECIGSKRKYGVEIETAHCPHHTYLYGRTNFGSKGDCSITGLEFDSPILYGDEGLKCIKEFLDFANSNNWEVDDECGCHTHYDVRDESDISLWRIAYAYARTSDFWMCFVPRWRRDCTYAHCLSYTWQDIQCRLRDDNYDQSFSDWCMNNERYDFINTSAYNDHGTFENRLLEGCIDSYDICSWITVHCRFIDYVKGCDFDNLDQIFNHHPRHIFSHLADIFDDTYLTNWMATRARRFGWPLRGPGSASWVPPQLRRRRRYD